MDTGSLEIVEEGKTQFLVFIEFGIIGDIHIHDVRRCPLKRSLHIGVRTCRQLHIGVHERAVCTDSQILDNLLAQTEMVHGTLLDINGVGVLLTGHSGMGKSETAIELINRGHRIIADDAVCVKRVRNELVGKAPENIKYFMEVRGLGIIDIKNMYGVGAVLESEFIDLVIRLDKINDLADYDRLGSMDNTCEILGISLPQINIPVMPGRNIAVIVEVATRNYLLKKMGYNALEDLKKRTNLDE